jgi:hypothetical protein
VAAIGAESTDRHHPARWALLLDIRFYQERPLADQIGSQPVASRDLVADAKMLAAVAASMEQPS